jgi:Alginate lyase
MRATANQTATCGICQNGGQNGGVRMKRAAMTLLCGTLSGAAVACMNNVQDQEDGDTTGSDATGSDATGSDATGSDPTSGDATSSDATDSTSPTEGSTTADSTSTGDEPTETDGPAPSVPGELLDLTRWKLTLPTGDGEPDEILPPALLTFEQPPQFWLDAAIPAVVFRAEAGGVTTSGSSYPRSELRELADGRELAAWSTTSGRHVMTIRQAITATPPVKPHVVAGQIHDADDDLVMIRLEGEHLFVEGDGDELGDLDPAYVLGTEFTVSIAVEDGTIDIYYDDPTTPAVSVQRDADGCYFKAGAYTQSNLEQGDAADAYGEVAIRELLVEHR